jgi:RNA polymerase sigma factor (sigma-70 family)
MAEPLTDAELIARVVVRDDRHAFSELVRRHQSQCARRCGRLTAGNHALADDLAQETFLLAFRNLRSFRQEAKFSTWLYRIATNAYLAGCAQAEGRVARDRDADVADDEGGDAPDEESGVPDPRGPPRFPWTWSARWPCSPPPNAPQSSSATIMISRTRRRRGYWTAPSAP